MMVEKSDRSSDRRRREIVTPAKASGRRTALRWYAVNDLGLISGKVAEQVLFRDARRLCRCRNPAGAHHQGESPDGCVRMLAGLLEIEH